MHLPKTATLSAGVLINSGVLGRMSRQNFELFCQEQKHLRVERNEAGEIEIMAPTHSQGGRINAEITRQLGNWNAAKALDLVFDSSTGFYVQGTADGVMRSPDASFLRRERYDALAPKQRQGFLPLCPDFVVELKSPSDALGHLRYKMTRYLAYGASLAWLIDPQTETVEVFRPEQAPEQLRGFDQVLSGAPTLPGFSLELARLRMS